MYLNSFTYAFINLIIYKTFLGRLIRMIIKNCVNNVITAFKKITRLIKTLYFNLTLHICSANTINALNPTCLIKKMYQGRKTFKNMIKIEKYKQKWKCKYCFRTLEENII